MALVILAFLIKRIADKLSSVIVRSPSENPATASEQELLKLERFMARIQATLDDAEKRGISEHSEQEKLFLRELREVVYDIEDVVDEHEYEVLRRSVEAPKQHGKVSLLNLPDNEKVYISDQLADRVTQTMERYKEIIKDRKDLKLPESDGKTGQAEKWVPMEWRETTSMIDHVVIFGREDEKKEIIERLLRGDQHEKSQISILPIIGMGGIGKTTLAQMVYNDQRIINAFDFRGWIYVSENVDVKHLMQNIMRSFSIDVDYEKLSLDMLCQILKKILEGKKFFLVLDDVWNEDHELWSSLKTNLLGVGGGEIIVTTRNGYVANIMQTTAPYHLNVLPPNHCWSLFEKIAFGTQKPRPNLVDIGQKIVEKCQGLPLAVKVLASILKSEKNENEWLNILENELWLLDKENEWILGVLKLSYDRMPIELRPCFMYLSLFPKGSPLEKAPIIKQWMSHGFLRPRCGKAEEDVGNACFNELLQRSLLQYDNVLRTDTFIMHDLIHDLAQSVARDEYLLITANRVPLIPKTIHHLSVHVREDLKIISSRDEIMRLWPNLKSLRTLVLHGVYNSSQVTDLLRNLTCLRTLILEEGIDLSDVIGNLKHLRYLHIPYVPNSVYKLYHLQTLNSDNEMKLSSEIGNLINLRHLHGYDTESLPAEIGGLTRLQTLEEFSLGVESWQCKVGHLKRLDNLRGSLTVRELGTVTWSDINDTNLNSCLKRKSEIENLKLYWGNDYDEDLAKCVLDYFQPHENLKQLLIEGYPGENFSVWLGDASFSRLEQLKLRRFSGCTSLPALGHLPALRRLEIVGMDRVRSVGPDLSCSSESVAVRRDAINFPALEFLRFELMSEWKEWKAVEDCDFPRLRQLELCDCPNMKALPSLSSLHELKLEKEFHRNLLFSSCFPNLQSLHICEFQETSLKFPEPQSLHSLGSLSIQKCANLMSLAGFGKMSSSLQHLAIDGCRRLRISTSELQPLTHMTVRISDSPAVYKSYDEALWISGQQPLQMRLEQNNDSGYQEISLERRHLIQSSGHAHQTSRMENDSGVEELDGQESRAKRRK